MAKDVTDRPFTTVSGVPIERLYSRRNIRDLDYEKDLGDPGEPPYTRGIYPDMYRGRLWTMRQFSGFGTAADTNRRFHYLLKNGQTGLSVAFHLPTLMGYDSDHPMSEGEVGKCGVAIDSLADMETLFEGIPLDQDQHVDDDECAGDDSVVDVPCRCREAGRRLEEAARHDSERHPEGIHRAEDVYLSAEAFDEADRRHVRVRNRNTSRNGTRSPSAATTSAKPDRRRFRNSHLLCTTASNTSNGPCGAGSTSMILRRGSRSFFNAHNDLFEEIAKYRAARKIWYTVMTERFHCKNPKSAVLRFHTQTAGCSLTAQQPYNNIVRVAIQALAAVLGGTQSLHTNSLDETLALPTEHAARIALRTQQIIAHETGITNTVIRLAVPIFSNG